MSSRWQHGATDTRAFRIASRGSTGIGTRGQDLPSSSPVELRLAKGPHDKTQSYICSKLQSARILNAGFGAGIFVSGID